jgi:preprotein translocase subunit YajC
MISLLHADPIAAGAQQAAPSPFMSLLPLVVIFGIFYFLMIRPQQKKLKEHKKMLDALQVGDKVITASGFYATIVGIGDASYDIKLSDNVKVKILKSSVSEKIGQSEPAAAK